MCCKLSCLGGTLADRISKHVHENLREKADSAHSFLADSSSQLLPSRVSTPSPVELPKLDYLEALRCAEALAEALRYLHDEADSERVIMHRDLKPDNVGFLADGTLQLIDFGLVTSTPRPSADSSSVLPRYEMTGHTGSLRYMAPEVALEKPYNHSVDTYSFAIIVWEMLARKKPFTGLGREAFHALVAVGGERPPIDKRTHPDLASLLQVQRARSFFLLIECIT